MISSLAIVVLLCGVVLSEESKLVKFLTDIEKGESRIEDLEETQSGYPVFIQQPLPIIIEKRIPYDVTRYDFYASPSVRAPSREELVYRPEVVRPPIIYTVGSQPAFSRVPNKVQKETWPLPCTIDDPNCLKEEFDYPVKRLAKKKKTFKLGEIIKQKNTKVSQRDVPISTDMEKKEGSVQHRETFQTPILIALEKPGYRYVKHIVGEGVLPKARQFHVLILEEDVSTDNPDNIELNSTITEQKDVPEKLSTDDIVNIDEQEEIIEGRKEKSETNQERSNLTDITIIFPLVKGESKAESKEHTS